MATLKSASYGYWYPYHDAMSTFPSLFTTGGQLRREFMNVLKEKNRNNRQEFGNVGSIFYVTYEGTKASTCTKITASEYFKARNRGLQVPHIDEGVQGRRVAMGKRRKCEIDKFTFVVQYTAIGKEHLQSRRDVIVVIEALLSPIKFSHSS